MQSRCDYAGGVALCKSTRLFLAVSVSGDTQLLQTPLALLEQHNHTNNATIASKGSGGEAPFAFLAAKAVFMNAIFAMVV